MLWFIYNMCYYGILWYFIYILIGKKTEIIKIINKFNNKEMDLLIKKTEIQRNSKILVLSKNNILFNDKLENASKTINFFRNIESECNVDVIINTKNELTSVAEIICNLFSLHKGKITVHIPNGACSSGFLIGLCADTICLGNGSFVCPIDTKISFFIFSVSLTNLSCLCMCIPKVGMLSGIVNYINSQTQISKRRLKNMLTKAKGVNDPETILIEFSSERNNDKPIFLQDIQDVCNVGIMPIDIMNLWDEIKLY